MSEQNTSQNIPTPSTAAAPEIFVMPQSYNQPPSPRKTGLLITLIIVLVLILVGGVGVWWLLSQKNSTTKVQVQVPANAILNTNSNSSAIALEGQQLTTTTATTSMVGAGMESTDSLAGNSAGNGQSLSVTPVSSSVDSDNDNLTDVEEAIYQTNPKQPDTDGDGYLDGEEVINGYSPLAAGKTLLQSGLVKNYTNTKYGFSVNYPASFTVEESADGSLAVFHQGENETITLQYQDNPEGLSAAAWYGRLLPEANNSQLTPVDFGALSGVFSLNNLAIYLTPKLTTAEQSQAVYIISESIGVKTTADLSATLRSLARSLKLK